MISMPTWVQVADQVDQHLDMALAEVAHLEVAEVMGEMMTNIIDVVDGELILKDTYVDNLKECGTERILLGFVCVFDMLTPKDSQTITLV